MSLTLIPRSGACAASRGMKARIHNLGLMARDALRVPHHEGLAPHLYESGSGESDGLANSFFSSALIGVARFRPFGGIFWVNHLS